ncbi:type I pantothenate kinase [Aestuariivirga litoralis]|uniref:type I pantothenate kinase n=1 Tax=Aestuariivirga litoralis TaxID=2650924 RepID=UPI0018C83D09|nr:type I pantothenate kinase [Aestuariivirga litoralis]MBG1232733.1 type I pantothenate kinase [Aestuariivirga litoralis]
MVEPEEDFSREVSPFRRFARDEWAALRADTPMTLTLADLDELRSLNDRIDLHEVEMIYLPLSRLLNLYVQASQRLFNASNVFLHRADRKVPYVIGVAGSVASGKSTTARILRRLLSRAPSHPKVDLVTTDGFLMPNARLEREGLMSRKGFPESYDLQNILRFMSAIKAGERDVEVPVYSHLTYDVLSEKVQLIDRPDVLIVEGINVLQTGRPPRDGRGIPNVSDFFDFSIFIDAEEPDLRQWYIERFFSLRDGAFADPKSFFHRYAALDDATARATATRIWETINLVNLRENILPTRPRADLVLRKGTDHKVRSVFLRRI